MATRNIVPRADSEGTLGTDTKRWSGAYIDALNGETLAVSGAASATEKGIVELATNAEAAGESVSNKALVPSNIPGAKIMRTGDAGTTWRMSRLQINDGTNANTIECQLLNEYNGDAISSVDNITKGGGGTDFQLDGTGAFLTIKAAELTGTVVAAGATGLNSSSGVSGNLAHLVVREDSGDIQFFARTAAGASIDWTSEIGTGSFSIYFFYITTP